MHLHFDICKKNNYCYAGSALKIVFDNTYYC